jgi:transposase
MPAPDERRTKMLDLARRWRDSGVSARVFAQEQGVTAWTLYYWRQRLAGRDRPTRRRRRSPRVTLAPVHVVAGARDAGGDLEIVLASGDRVRVAAGVSAHTLRQVVAVLRTAC